MESVSFRCWAAINLVGEISKRSRTPHPLPYPPFSFLTVWRVLHPFSFLTMWRVLLMSNEEQDTPPPTLPTLFLPHCVKSSTSLFLPHCMKSALDEQWGAGHPTPTIPTLFLPHCVKSSTSLFLPHCVKSSAWVIICVFHAHLLQCWHTETLGVWLIHIVGYWACWILENLGQRPPFP